jgi:hypothetical protein
MNGVVWSFPMNDIPILFGKTIDDLRHIGALGGRAHARNCRARQKARLVTSSAPIPASIPPTQETTAEAVATLDAQFGWLRGAERRCERRSASRRR